MSQDHKNPLGASQDIIDEQPLLAGMLVATIDMLTSAVFGSLDRDIQQDIYDTLKKKTQEILPEADNDFMKGQIYARNIMLYAMRKRIEENAS